MDTIIRGGGGKICLSITTFENLLPSLNVTSTLSKPPPPPNHTDSGLELEYTGTTPHFITRGGPQMVYLFNGNSLSTGKTSQEQHTRDIFLKCTWKSHTHINTRGRGPLISYLILSIYLILSPTWVTTK